ncbi:Leucyl aminopeptidase [Acidimicrobium ferrooxidans DSM 10331]|uniref:Probable cytosol aminopeptidase n=1 Tax=Acidimicrobium ferrooxidans (strain DSM 10331 / JCM 15462 / NBRC 103882 / ICP) TaxID=525909 RepID=C7LY66_ACIFD|nr:leucyl aminopeptidase [Acidimicrobium ferrooxidans]ACU53674.1 Leucyl aminopeptidase [Acidimicrobium ferrooxidans DSM 10331]
MGVTTNVVSGVEARGLRVRLDAASEREDAWRTEIVGDELWWVRGYDLDHGARGAGADVVALAADRHATDVSVDLGSHDAIVAEEFALGALLASYRFDRYRHASAPAQTWPTEVVVMGDVARAALQRARSRAEAVALARDLVNEPPSRMTPTVFAQLAEQVADAAGLEVRVWDRAACEAEGLGGLLGVARGSVEEPRVVHLVYRPGAPTGEPVALVGKGITFDSGGLSLKSADGMMSMKTDMAGAAAILAAMSVLGELGCTREVRAYLMLTENLPSGSAQKPGDVLVTRSGTTIEVLNTDAEGRLVLADGLALAVEDGASAIVDLATLTGACVVALGDEVAGIMGSDPNLIGALRAAGDREDEPLWELPLPSRYEAHIKSSVADVKNMGKPGKAGAIAAALLLKRFVGSVPWAHLDIAGPARADGDRGWVREGATGFGVLTLTRWLCGPTLDDAAR